MNPSNQSVAQSGKISKLINIIDSKYLDKRQGIVNHQKPCATVPNPTALQSTVQWYTFNWFGCSDVEAEAEAGSGSAGSGYFLWKRKKHET